MAASQHPGDKTSHSLAKPSDRHAQFNDDVNRVSDDPNLVGWADIKPLYDPNAGPMTETFYNEDYRDFFLEQRLPDSALFGNADGPYNGDRQFEDVNAKDYHQTRDEAGSFGERAFNEDSATNVEE